MSNGSGAGKPTRARKLPCQRFSPGTGAEIFFHYRAPFQRVDEKRLTTLDNTHLLCVRHHPLPLAEMSEIGFVAIRFRAGALHHFVSIPGRELIDRLPTAADPWGSAGKELAKGMHDAESNQARIALLQAFLLNRIDQRERIHMIRTAAIRLYRRCDSLSISDLATALGLSRRQLKRQFLLVTGQTLVEVRRLSRF